jgi:FMN phosphatase YigB (HAD superfamily)
LPGLTAVIFDWGGTLASFVPVDVADLWREAARCLSGPCGGRDVEELAADLGAADIAAFRASLESWDSWNVNTHLAAWGPSAGLAADHPALAEAGRSYLAAWEAVVRHEDDAVPMLREVKALGLEVGLLSNTHWPGWFHDQLLDRDGLGPYIDARAYTSEMARTKPDPAPFEAILAVVGCPAGEAVYVGDRPRDDIWGAQQVGMRAVWRSHSHSPPLDGVVPDAIIDRLSDLPAVLARWQAAG